MAVPSGSARYYVVQKTADLKEEIEGGEVCFGDGVEREYFYEWLGGERNLFYRVRIGEVGLPEDIDGDGIVDLYELERPGDIRDGSFEAR